MPEATATAEYRVRTMATKGRLWIKPRDHWQRRRHPQRVSAMPRDRHWIWRAPPSRRCSGRRRWRRRWGSHPTRSPRTPPAARRRKTPPAPAPQQGRAMGASRCALVCLCSGPVGPDAPARMNMVCPPNISDSNCFILAFEALRIRKPWFLCFRQRPLRDLSSLPRRSWLRPRCPRCCGSASLPPCRPATDGPPTITAVRPPPLAPSLLRPLLTSLFPLSCQSPPLHAAQHAPPRWMMEWVPHLPCPYPAPPPRGPVAGAPGWQPADNSGA